MTARSLALLIGSIATVAVILALVPDVPTAVDAVVGVIVVVFGPGLSLLLALRTVPGMAPPTAVTLMLTISVAFAVVVGVVLAALPIGLTDKTGPVTLAALTVVLSGAALVRPDERRVIGTREFHLKANAPGIALLAVSLAVAVGAVAFARLGAQRTDSDGQVTELSVAFASDDKSVDVHIANHQENSTDFRVVVSAVSGSAPGRQVAERSLRLPDGAVRTFTVALPSGVLATSVRTQLFVAGHAQALRTVGAQ